MSPKKLDVRPFNDDAGYTLAVLADMPGGKGTIAVEIHDKVQIFDAPIKIQNLTLPGTP